MACVIGFCIGLAAARPSLFAGFQLHSERIKVSAGHFGEVETRPRLNQCDPYAGCHRVRRRDRRAHNAVSFHSSSAELQLVAPYRARCGFPGGPPILTTLSRRRKLDVDSCPIHSKQRSPSVRIMFCSCTYLL